MEIDLQNYSSWLRVDHEWTTADTTAVCLLFAGVVLCPTVPLQHNGGWESEELNRQYTCEWKDSGKEKEGRLILKNGSRGYTATLLDKQGNRYCPTGWKSEDGCLPVVMPK